MGVTSTSLGSLSGSNLELVKLYSEIVLLVELVYKEKSIVELFFIL
jgi:hypothetical protein